MTSPPSPPSPPAERAAQRAAERTSDRAMAAVAFAAAASLVLILIVDTKLKEQHVIGPAATIVLGVAYAAVLVICACRCLAAAMSATYHQLAPLAVLSLGVVLATFGILTRMALHETRTPAYAQQLAVLLGLAGCIAVAMGTSRVVRRPRARMWILPLLAVCFLGFEVAASPTRPLSRPGGGAPANWAEPFLYVALLGLIALLLTRGFGPLTISAPVRLAIAPAAWVVAFALTRDLASVSVLAGAVATWHCAEPRASRPIEPHSWPVLAAAVAACGIWILSWGVAFNEFTGARDLLGTTPSARVRYRLGHLADTSSGTHLRFLVPVPPGAVFGLIAGLAAALVILVALLGWMARGIEDRWAASWAKGLTAFLAAQVVLAFVGLLPGHAAGFPAPFLSSSAVWNGADALAVAVVIGLASMPTPSPVTDIR